jgi:hypothetical protein
MTDAFGARLARQRAERQRPDSGSICAANAMSNAIATGQTARQIHSRIMIEAKTTNAPIITARQ